RAGGGSAAAAGRAARLTRRGADEALRRISAPLADESLLGREQVRAATRVQPVGVRPTLVHATPRVRPVVVDLAAEQVPSHAPHVVVLAEARQVLVVLEDRVHVGP